MKNIKTKIERDTILTQEQLKEAGFRDTQKIFGYYKVYKLHNRVYLISETEEGDYKIGFNCEEDWK